MADRAVPESNAARLASKARRVAGTFVLMIGAGLILDIRALWIGAPIMAVGAALFAWGFVVPRPHEGVAARLGETEESHS